MNTLFFSSRRHPGITLMRLSHIRWSLFVLILCGTTVMAQPRLQWAARYNGTADGDDFGRTMQVDRNGNVYLAGSSVNNGTQRDFTIVKFDANGQLLWTVSLNGSLNRDDWALGLVLDRSGNVIAAGSCETAGEGQNFLTVKCGPDGAVQWTREYNGTGSGNDVASDVTVDDSGNVYVTGTSMGDTTLSDFATIMYDPDGNAQWIARYDGPAHAADEARAIALHPEGGVCVAGGSTGIGSGYDIAIVRYDPNGIRRWVARYDGPGSRDDIVYYRGALVVDEQANAYATGYSVGDDGSIDYALMKCGANGNQLWIRRYESPDSGTDYANTVALDNHGNVYVTGGSEQTGRSYDFVTRKYSAEGDFLWTARYDGTANDWDEAYALAVDSAENVYVAGRSVGAATAADFVLVKYSPTGELIWDVRYNQSAGYDWPFSLSLTRTGDLFIGGYVDAFSGSARGADFLVLKYSISTTAIGALPSTDALRLNVAQQGTSRANLRVSFDLPKRSDVSLMLYDILGRRVGTQYFGLMDRGGHVRYYDAGALPAGMYILLLTAGQSSRSSACIVLRK